MGAANDGIRKHERWSNKNVVIPGLPAASSRAEPACVCRTANANAEGGLEGERHGSCESTQ